MAVLGVKSIQDIMADGLPAPLKQGLSFLIMGGVVVTGFFTLLSQPLAQTNQKVEQQGIQIEESKKVIQQHEDKINKMVDVVSMIAASVQQNQQQVKDIAENQNRQETLVGKINDKLDRLLERH